MSNRPPRRVPVPQQPPQDYTSLAQTSPRSHRQRSTRHRSPQPQPPPQLQPQPERSRSSRPSSSNGHGQTGRREMASGVARGAIGGGYGPYSYHPDPSRDAGVYNNPRFSQTVASDVSSLNPEKSHFQQNNFPQNTAHTAPAPTTTTVPQALWDKDPDLDDALHNPDPIRDAQLDRSWTLFSARGWMNAGALVVIVSGLLMLFAGYPIFIQYTRDHPHLSGFNLGGINASGQVPDLVGVPRMIDSKTPGGAYSRTGSDGKKYSLVFSDEFETEGRTFYPGDDPFWEAADLHYWPTGDLEWYDPSAITTADGKLVITITEQQVHGLDFMSGMLTSWNKLCFNTGYIEVSISMPGEPTAPGLWPGAWTMGNLGRAGYGATTEGMWPYSYDTCDLGTFPNQTARDGTPTSSLTGGTDGAPLSYLPGQRLSACTCPGSDHPGPSTSTGRGVPEVDIIETQVNVSDNWQGQVSQSFQIAPYNYQYEIVRTSPASTIYDAGVTRWNTYKGGVYQQAASAVTDIDGGNYGGRGYASYGYEWYSDPSDKSAGYVTWYSQGKESWQLTAATIGPDETSMVGQRIVSEEPMYIILNLGLAPGFQKQDFKHLVFPSKMYVDYVRVYQRTGTKNGVTCDPPKRPTAAYIDRHIKAYTNPNLTTWAQAGNTFPRNSLYDGC